MTCQAGWSTSWNQDCLEKYQWYQIHRWHHLYGRKQSTSRDMSGWWCTSWNLYWKEKYQQPDSTLMAESEEELKRLFFFSLQNFLMNVKEESEKSELKLNIQETKVLLSCLMSSWQIQGKKSESSDRIYFLGLQNHCRWWPQLWN